MDFFQKTDIGLKRENNEDAIGVFKNKSQEALAVIADGMGGHLGGDVASNLALKQVGLDFAMTESLKAQDFISWVDDELFKVNDTIIKKAQSRISLHGMGTTFVGAFLSEDHKIVFVNLGDTRGYLFKDGVLKQITIDQTLVNELLHKGELSQKEAETFPNKNIITSSLGVDQRVDAIYKVIDLNGSESILLSSDGLTNMVSDDLIADLLSSGKSPQTIVDDLVQEAIKNGGVDNISVILGVNSKGSDKS